MSKIIVKLDNDKSYPIIIEENILENSKYFKKYLTSKKIFIITDNIVAKKYLKTLQNSLKKEGFFANSIILKPGEYLKSFSSLEKISNKILAHNIDRKATIIALGGGVIGDLSGFIASILLRGINFVQIPTTFLAQIDSSVGGKTAINSKFGKNLIGSFYHPKAVLIDPTITASLPFREYLSGYGEAVKYALINDKQYFLYLEKNEEKIKNRDLTVIKYIIKKSCEKKAEIVSQDEKEQSGVRALLNLGHTFAHSLEKATNYSNKLRHGEAVAVGIIMALEFSCFLKICQREELIRVKKHFEQIGLMTSIKQIKKHWDKEELVNNMKSDKKNEDDKIIFILLAEIGKSLVKKDVAIKDIIKFLNK